MALEIIDRGDKQEDVVLAFFNDPERSRYRCPECRTVVEGTNADVADNMTLFNRVISRAEAYRRFQRGQVEFNCPVCLAPRVFNRRERAGARPEAKE